VPCVYTNQKMLSGIKTSLTYCKDHAKMLFLEDLPISLQKSGDEEAERLT
jgi:hypothetical protein